MTYGEADCHALIQLLDALGAQVDKYDAGFGALKGVR